MLLSYSLHVPAKAEEEEDKEEKIGDGEGTDEQTAESVHFSPLSINTYSKFGRTCLHDAIRNVNVDLVKALIEAGADVSAPVYDINLSVASAPDTFTSFPVIGNCLSEAVAARNELILLVVLNSFKYDEDNFSLAYRCCHDLCQAEMNGDDKGTSLFSPRKAAQYLLRCKVVVDPEYKVQVKGSVFGSPTKGGVSQESGLVLNWTGLRPGLSAVYECK